MALLWTKATTEHSGGFQHLPGWLAGDRALAGSSFFFFPAASSSVSELSESLSESDVPSAGFFALLKQICTYNSNFALMVLLNNSSSIIYKNNYFIEYMPVYLIHEPKTS
jgi:hypothetical protein